MELKHLMEGAEQEAEGSGINLVMLFVAIILIGVLIIC